MFSSQKKNTKARSDENISRSIAKEERPKGDVVCGGINILRNARKKAKKTHENGRRMDAQTNEMNHEINTHTPRFHSFT